MPAATLPVIRACRPAWYRGRVVGQKRPLMPKPVWAIHVHLEIAGRLLGSIRGYRGDTEVVDCLA